MLLNFTRRLAWGMAALAGAGALAVSHAGAQIPAPPATVFGSITDSAGPVPEKLKVEAYIGEKLCGEGATEYTGDGASRVTVYFADVVSDQQTAGCGKAGAEVRIKIGDRFASQTFKWESGPTQLNVTFGTAAPAAIPTFTPTPPRAETPAAGATSGAAAAGAVETIPPGSPGAGSPVARNSSGGVTSADPKALESLSDDGDGFPIWAVAVLVLGGIAVVGGGVGFLMSRSRDTDEDYLFPRRDREL